MVAASLTSDGAPSRQPRSRRWRFAWSTDAEHRFTAVSSPLAALLGVERRDMLGRSRLACWPRGDGDLPAWEAHLEAVRARNAFHDVACTMPLANGRTIALRVEGRPRFSNDWRFLGYRGTVGLGDENRSAEHVGPAFGSPEHPHDASFALSGPASATVPIDGWSLDVATGALFWPDAVDHVLGHRPAPTGTASGSAKAFVHADDLGDLRVRLSRAGVNGSPVEALYRVVLGDGEVRWHRQRGTCKMVDDDRIHGCDGTVQDVTGDRVWLDAQRAREREFNDAQAIAGVGSWRLHLATGEIEWTDELYRIMGFRPGSVLPSRNLFRQLLHPDDRDAHLSRVAAAVRAKQAYRAEYRIVRPDGEQRVILTNGRCSLDADGRVVGMLGTMQDVTEQRNTERVLHEQAVMLRETQELAGIGTSWRPIDAEMSSWSDVMYRLLGLQPGEVDPCFATVHALVHPDDRARHRALVDDLAPGRNTEAELRIIRPDGQVRTHWVRVHLEATGIGGTPWMFTTHLDITALKDAEKQLESLAFYDSLTGLPNRAMFRRELLALAEAANSRSGTIEAVLLLDLDRFKEVNDTLGHAAGDMLLVQVAQRLRRDVRGGDLVARLGGDEFALIVRRVGTIESVAQTAERIATSLRVPFDLDGHEAHISCSIGIALVGGHTSDAETLLRQADLALYAVKERGRDSHRFFEPELNRIVMHRRTIETELRAALRTGGLELHYQPQFDLHTMQPCGAEALLRWNRGEDGYLAPDQFIPIAESSGLIVDLGGWIIDRAAEDAARIQRECGRLLPIAVNLSAVQLRDPSLIDRIGLALQRSGLQPSLLHVELTEGVFADRRDGSIMRSLERLGAMDLTLCLDDFGTGYSSLSYLADMPFKVLKVDRRFVGAIGVEPRTAAIVPAVIGLGRSLGLAVVAEGIETDAQLEHLRGLGCDMGQGYRLGRPRPLADLAALLALATSNVTVFHKRRKPARPPRVEVPSPSGLADANS